MVKRLKKDVVAGFCVFLLALPLCLGIATLSNFPPIAGIIAAVVGGIAGAWLGGAALSIKGPAAGLAAIVIASVQELGAGDVYLGYKRTLAVGAVAGVIQVLIGFTRKAVMAEIIPPFVIHGMLAAIGIVIVSKQSYVMMGLAPMGSGPLALLVYLPTQIIHANPLLLAIGLFSLGVVIIWPKIKIVSAIPSSIVILVSVILLSLSSNLTSIQQYTFLGNHYSLGQSSFIHLPLEWSDIIQFPDFSVVFSVTSVKYILMFAIIGSIESSLAVCAIDAISFQKTPSNLNRDAWAIGVCNIISSLLGGLPMISEIVRSKANIDYGAVSAKANFFHGLFMLGAVILFAPILNCIPLAALAALLVLVGFRLAAPKEFIHAYQVGKDQFALFLTALFVTLATDLLMGVLAGVLLKIILLLARGNGLKQLFLPVITAVHVNETTTRIQIEGPLTFVSYLKLKKIIEQASKRSEIVIISLYEVTYLDHTVLKKLLRLGHEFHPIQISIEENQELVPFYAHELSARKRR
jgi:MFS superfamily sulfate permease-like transporter